jgi:hypothetical protein
MPPMICGSNDQPVVSVCQTPPIVASLSVEMITEMIARPILAF